MVVSEAEDMPRTNCTLFILNMIYSIKCWDTQFSILFCQAVWEKRSELDIQVPFSGAGDPHPSERTKIFDERKNTRTNHKTSFRSRCFFFHMYFFVVNFYAMMFQLRWPGLSSWFPRDLYVSSQPLAAAVAVGKDWKRTSVITIDHKSKKLIKLINIIQHILLR